jgi:hypothetical protein
METTTMSDFPGRRCFLAAPLLTALALAVDAKAEPPRGGASHTTIVVRRSDCDSDGRELAAILRLLEVELTAERVRFSRYDAPPEPGELVVEVQWAPCSPSSREATIKLRRASRETLERSVALGDLPAEARPRALALAVAELIRSTRAAWKREAEAVLAAESEPDAPAREPRAPYVIDARDAAAQSNASRGPSGFTLQAAAGWRIFAPVPTSMFGAQAAAMLPVVPARFFVRADAGGFWSGTATDQLGTVKLASYSGGLGLMYATSHNPMFFFGPHLEVGYASASTTADSPNLIGTSSGSTLVTASVIASLRAVLHGPLAATAEVEGGATLLGLAVRVEDRTIASMRGGFAAARVGLALAY